MNNGRNESYRSVAVKYQRNLQSLFEQGKAEVFHGSEAGPSVAWNDRGTYVAKCTHRFMSLQMQQGHPDIHESNGWTPESLLSVLIHHMTLEEETSRPISEQKAILADLKAIESRINDYRQKHSPIR